MNDLWNILLFPRPPSGSYGKCTIIADIPIHIVIFHSYVNVYQRLISPFSHGFPLIFLYFPRIFTFSHSFHWIFLGFSHFPMVFPWFFPWFHQGATWRRGARPSPGSTAASRSWPCGPCGCRPPTRWSRSQRWVQRRPRRGATEPHLEICV